MNRKSLKQAARQCIRDARGGVKRVTIVYLLVVLLLAAVEVGITFLGESAPQSGKYLSDSISSTVGISVAAYGISLCIQFVLILLEAGYTLFALRLSRNEEFTTGVLLEGLGGFFRIIGFYILRNLYTALWMMVAVLPASVILGIIAGGMGSMLPMPVISTVAVAVSAAGGLWAYYRYWGSFFVLMDAPELGISETLRHTININRGYRVKLFLLDMSFIPTILLCTITCGILLVWKLPYIQATYAHAYHQMHLTYQQNWSRT